MIYNQIVTWTAFAILALFFVRLFYFIIALFLIHMGFNIKRRFSTLDDPKPVNRINFCLFCQDGNKHKKCRLIIDIRESFALIKFKSTIKVHTHLPEKLRNKEINFSSKRRKAILQGKKNPQEKNYFLQNSISLKEGIQFCKKELFLKSWMWHWMTFQVSGGIFRGFQRIGTDHFDSQG